MGQVHNKGVQQSVAVKAVEAALPFFLPALNVASAESGTSKKKNKPLRSTRASRLKNIDIFLTL